MCAKQISTGGQTFFVKDKCPKTCGTCPGANALLQTTETMEEATETIDVEEAQEEQAEEGEEATEIMDVTQEAEEEETEDVKSNENEARNMAATKSG